MKSQLADAKSELKSLQDGVKSADTDSIERAKELIDDIIPGLEAQLEKAVAQQAILDRIDATADEEEVEVEMEETQKK